MVQAIAPQKGTENNASALRIDDCAAGHLTVFPSRQDTSYITQKICKNSSKLQESQNPCDAEAPCPDRPGAASLPTLPEHQRGMRAHC